MVSASFNGTFQRGIRRLWGKKLYNFDRLQNISHGDNTIGNFQRCIRILWSKNYKFLIDYNIFHKLFQHHLMVPFRDVSVYYEVKNYTFLIDYKIFQKWWQYHWYLSEMYQNIMMYIIYIFDRLQNISQMVTIPLVTFRDVSEYYELKIKFF